MIRGRAAVGIRSVLLLGLQVAALLTAASTQQVEAGALLAGVAKVDVTSTAAGPVNDPLFVKSLVLKSGDTTAVVITVDAVAIAEIGPIRNGYLAEVRQRLEQDLKIPPTSVMINASHCHGIVCDDIAERTVQAVQQAVAALTPVRIGAGAGHEDRVMENRRLKLKDGRQADVRHAYSLPADAAIESVGPIDPEIGLLRIDRMDGGTLAVVYNFACHPILGVPSGGNTADMTGFASQVVEDNLPGAVALFLQGCGGDINPVRYKDFDQPRNAQTLGNLLGLSVLAGTRRIDCKGDGPLKVINETLTLPRRDNAERIAALTAEQQRLVASLGGTSLNFKTFLPLAVKYGLNDVNPSAESHRYLQDKLLGRADQERLDADNRRNIEQYVRNIHTMEELTRLQTNLALLKKHQATNVAAGSRTMDVELVGLRAGEFTLLTFPGELTVQIGLNLKQASPHELTFVAGYTNGYIYYAPTAEQLLNAGAAQEDCDTLLAPEWQALYEARAMRMLETLWK